MKKIVLVVLIFFLNISFVMPIDCDNSSELDYFLYPLIRVSYDFNLGFTTSIGGGVMFTKGEPIGGPYFLYSFSHKSGRNYIDGKTFSAGLYGGVGIASFRVGINKMIIKHVVTQEDRYKRGGIHNLTNFSDRFLIHNPGSYWGLEASSMFFGVTSSGGFLFDGDETPKFNGSIGLGIF